MPFLPIAIDQNNVIGNQGGSSPADWFTYLNGLGASGTLGDLPWLMSGWASSFPLVNWPSRIIGGQQFGPWKSPGGNLYYVLEGVWNPPTTPGPGVPQNVWFVQVFKSTDGGVTWETLNPIWGPEDSASFVAWYDGLNTISVLVFNRPADTGWVSYQTFDLTTELWTTPAALPSFYWDAVASTDRQIYPDNISSIFLRPDTTLLMLGGAGFQANNSGPGYQTPFDGGARFQAQAYPDLVNPVYWQTPFFIDANFPNSGGLEGMSTAIKAVMDSTGVVHCFFAFKGTASYFGYQQILLDNSLGPFCTLTAMPAPGTNALLQFGSPFIWGTKLLLPISDGTTPGFFFLAADLATPTVWTKIGPVDPDAGTDAFLYASDGGAGAFAFDGTTLYLLNICPTITTGANQGARIRVCWTTDLVNWQAQTLWDMTGSAFDVPGQLLTDIDGFPGSLGVTFSMLGPSGFSGRFTLSPMFLPPAIPTLSCNAPPQGIQTVPYSHAFPAAGGTPPYTFAITGGSLPPGIVLNPATGVASGTPTSYGTSAFTIQVTDSIPNTASVNCSITILPALIDVEIVLRGVKRYRPGSTQSETLEAVQELPHVKRAV